MYLLLVVWVPIPMFCKPYYWHLKTNQSSVSHNKSYYCYAIQVWRRGIAAMVYREPTGTSST